MEMFLDGAVLFDAFLDGGGCVAYIARLHILTMCLVAGVLIDHVEAVCRWVGIVPYE